MSAESENDDVSQQDEHEHEDDTDLHSDVEDSGSEEEQEEEEQVDDVRHDNDVTEQHNENPQTRGGSSIATIVRNMLILVACVAALIFVSQQMYLRSSDIQHLQFIVEKQHKKTHNVEVFSIYDKDRMHCLGQWCEYFEKPEYFMCFKATYKKGARLDCFAFLDGGLFVDKVWLFEDRDGEGARREDGNLRPARAVVEPKTWSEESTLYFDYEVRYELTIELIRRIDPKYATMLEKLHSSPPKGEWFRVPLGEELSEQNRERYRVRDTSEEGEEPFDKTVSSDGSDDSVTIHEPEGDCEIRTGACVK